MRSATRSNLLVPEIREVMDIRQASDYLGISPDTLYKYASEGFVPAFKLGNRWRFKRSRLDEWMDRQSEAQAAVTGRAQTRKPHEFPTTSGKTLKPQAKPRYIQEYRSFAPTGIPLCGDPPCRGGSYMRNAAARSNLLVPEIREVMDIRQASDYLGISPDTLYKYASDGFVPAFKLGNRWRFKRSRLDEWMDRQSDLQAASPEIDPHAKKPVRPAL